ncbi:MAG: acyltransferase family protein [Methanosphaera sp.]|nr:acyltransferase family protein [Methanosphaera sp.]
MIQKEYMVTTRNPTKSREISFDILRIMASFAVMMIHISSQNWYEVDIYSYEWMIFSFYDSISRWGVPIFVMISGALFLGNCRSIKRIYKRNIFRIITAFIFWSFFYASIMFVCGCSLKEALACFFRGFYHMWFLFMIIGLYMITPFLVAIVKDKKLINYFLLLSLLFAFALPQCISIISMISSEYGTFLQSL